VENRKNDRTSLSLVVSTLLHGSVIALVALGPAYLPGLVNSGNGKNTASTVEITVTDAAATKSQDIITTPADIQPIRQPKVTPAPAPKIIEKPLAKQKIARPQTPKTLPEKIAAAPAVEVSDIAEAPEVAAMPDSDSAEAPRTPPAKEEVVEQQVVKNEDVPTPQTQEKSKVIEEPKVTDTPQMTEAPQATSDVAPAVATSTAAAAPTTATTTSAATSTPKGETKTIQVTQNYLELKQLPGNKAPTYSPQMRLHHLEGRGQLVYFVTKSGEVGEIHLVKSTGSPDLDQAALGAFKKYRFVPGQEGYTVHDFEFVLKGPAETNSARLRTSSN
jgi:TonB family protein